MWGVFPALVVLSRYFHILEKDISKDFIFRKFKIVDMIYSNYFNNDYVLSLKM